MTAFGYTFHDLQFGSASFQPATDNQLVAIAKNQAWREIASRATWHEVLKVLIKTATGDDLGSPMSIRHASLILDFYINASPESKKRLEKNAFENLAVRGDSSGVVANG